MTDESFSNRPIRSGQFELGSNRAVLDVCGGQLALRRAQNLVVNKCTYIGVCGVLLSFSVLLMAGGCGSDQKTNPTNRLNGRLHDSDLGEPLGTPDPNAPDPDETRAIEMAGLNPADTPAHPRKLPADVLNLPHETYSRALGELGLSEEQLLQRLNQGFGVKVNPKKGGSLIELIPPK